MQEGRGSRILARGPLSAFSSRAHGGRRPARLGHRGPKAAQRLSARAMATLLEELSPRDFISDVTPGLAERLAQGPITGYVGFDPTADSLHVGNLVPVMGLAWLQR